MTAPSPGALGRLGRETPLQQGGAPEQAGPLFEGGTREAALGPLSRPPAPSPSLTNASLPPNGHRPLLGRVLGGAAPVGPQAAFQGILGP